MSLWIEGGGRVEAVRKEKKKGWRAQGRRDDLPQLVSGAASRDRVSCTRAKEALTGESPAQFRRSSESEID